MGCSACGKLISIDGFGGYGHYRSTKTGMDLNVQNGYFKVVNQDRFETVYQCLECKKEWVLAEPDFPVAGYLKERKYSG